MTPAYQPRALTRTTVGPKTRALNHGDLKLVVGVTYDSSLDFVVFFISAVNTGASTARYLPLLAPGEPGRRDPTGDTVRPGWIEVEKTTKSRRALNQ